MDALVVTDELKRRYLLLANQVALLYRAILPDRAASEFMPGYQTLKTLADKIRSLAPEVDISRVVNAVEDLLDRSIEPTGYTIKGAAKTIGEASANQDRLLDLGEIDFDALSRRFAESRKHIEVAKLRGAIQGKLRKLMLLNRTRANYYDEFQRLIDDYNAGTTNVDVLFAKLVAFAQGLNAEEQRGIAEQLTEEELAVFDLLIKPDVKLTKKEQAEVKKIARDLLVSLKAGRLVLDWRKKQQARAAVRLCIEETLDRLPPTYSPPIYRDKCDRVYQHVYDSYFGQGTSVYAVAV